MSELKPSGAGCFGRGRGMNQIRIEKCKVYLDKWLVGTIVKSFTEKRFFAADVDYCSPLDANNLRDLADKLDELNGVKAEVQQ